VTSTATSRGRCSSSNRPTAEFQFLQILRRRVAAPGRERNPSAWVHSNQWGEAMPYLQRDQRTVLPASLTLARCCKFRKFGKFRLQIAQLAQRPACMGEDPRSIRTGIPCMKSSFDKINRRFKITIVRFIQKTYYPGGSNPQLHDERKRAQHMCHWNTRLLLKHI